MKTENKKKYVSPTIEQVRLDNEISLILQSEPFGDPEGWSSLNQSNDPFKTAIS